MIAASHKIECRKFEEANIQLDRRMRESVETTTKEEKKRKPKEGDDEEWMMLPLQKPGNKIYITPASGHRLAHTDDVASKEEKETHHLIETADQTKSRK